MILLKQLSPFVIMGFRTLGLFAILSVSLCLARDEEPQQPLVAFMCNKPAMYLTDNGWVEDRTSDCITEPSKILDYCRKVYPGKEITNVVESNELVTIDDWCGFDASRCHHHNQHTVRPFRCLVGPFQSDALLVPEHCLFDHVHGEQCARYMAWNNTAARACANHSMRLDSFAMLQPCIPEVNLFNGVEFVCCPDNGAAKKADKSYIVEDDSDILPDEDSSFWQPQPKDSKSDPNAILPNRNPQPKNSYDDVVAAPKSENDVYAKYITGERGAEFYNEHEFFLKAKSDMAKHHHERVAGMMKDWAGARQRIADLKAVDVKGAETLEKEMTARFQKTYEALEQEAVEEKQQMTAIHQQRVQNDLNEKKRDNLENFMDELTKKKPDAAAILKALKKYVKSEEKDREHTLNHYRHVEESVEDGADALHEIETVRQQALDHMEIINQRIQQAVDMLRQVPELEKKIRDEIADYIETFTDLDIAITDTLMKLPEPKYPEPEVIKPQPIISEQAETYEQVGQEMLERVEKVETDEYKGKGEETFVDNDDIYRVPLQAGNGIGISTWDDEVQEDEHDLPETHHQANVVHANNMRNDKMDVKVMQDPKMSMRSSGKANNSVYSASTTAGIAVAAVAVFVILVVGGLFLKRNSHSRRSTRGFIAVDTSASPEERHVANMQMNGYENPTYRYFEKNQTGTTTGSGGSGQQQQA